MTFRELDIGGVWVIEAEPFVDERGQFFRHFCKREFSGIGIESDIKQTNVSKNTSMYTLRGFHFQYGSHQEAKTMFSFTGAFHVKVVDIRPESKTFMQHVSVDLSENEPRSLHIPKGCAVAFLTMEDNSTMLYYMYEFFKEDSYSGFRYDDPAFGFVWPAKPRVISAKDRNYADFNVDEYESKALG